MNVLVTGALGHVGSRLIRDLQLAEPITCVRMLDNLHTQRYCSLFNFSPPFPVEFVPGDIRDAAVMQAACAGMDLVIHLAAATNAPETAGSSAAETFEVNVAGTQTVLDAAEDAGVRQLVFTSSTSVYGPSEGTATEEAPRANLHPQSPYAESKLQAEEAVMRADQAGGMRCTVLRLGTIFGVSPGMRFHTAVNRFVFQACHGQPLTVWDGALHEIRPYLDLGDAVRAIAFVAGERRCGGECFNVLTLNTTVAQVLGTLRRHVPGLTVTATPRPLLNQIPCEVDATKLTGMGFRYQGDLDAAIAESVTLLSKQRPG